VYDLSYNIYTLFRHRNYVLTLSYDSPKINLTVRHFANPSPDPLI